ncbi:MAG TPA: helix-turn-helix domain-containing protein [Polyangia bacterium]|jgi:transposase
MAPSSAPPPIFDPEPLLPAALSLGGHPLDLPHVDRPLLDLLMLLEGSMRLMSVAELCAKYGYRSTRSYYEKRRLFERQGVAGLLPQPRGPKRPSRRTPSVEQRVVAARVRDPDLAAAQIAERLRAAGVRLSARSVERILSDYGLTRGP